MLLYLTPMVSLLMIMLIYGFAASDKMGVPSSSGTRQVAPEMALPLENTSSISAYANADHLSVIGGFDHGTFSRNRKYTSDVSLNCHVQPQHLDYVSKWWRFVIHHFTKLSYRSKARHNFLGISQIFLWRGYWLLNLGNLVI